MKPEPQIPEPSETMDLTEHDAVSFVAALLDDAPPSDRLIQAARDYLRRVDPGGTR